MDAERLKKRNRILLLLVLTGLLCFIFVEWLISGLQSEEIDWETVNTDLEGWLDWEADFAGSDEPQIININEAMEAALNSLSGIGPSKANAIVTYRETHGPFTSIEQIMEVPGIGPATFENIKERITVGEIDADQHDVSEADNESENSEVDSVE